MSRTVSRPGNTFAVISSISPCTWTWSSVDHSLHTCQCQPVLTYCPEWQRCSSAHDLCSSLKTPEKQHQQSSSLLWLMHSPKCSFPIPCVHSLIRPPNIVVSGLIFYQCFDFFFFCPLISELTERNSNISGHMVGSAIWKRMSEIWGIPSPYKSLAQKPPFWADFAT